jgi:hypothetical protein
LDGLMAAVGTKEPEHGTTYSTMSRVTKMQNFGIVDGLTVSSERRSLVTNNISNHDMEMKSIADNLR